MEEQVHPSITIAKVKNSSYNYIFRLPVYHLGLLITTKQATRDAEKSMKEYEANTDTCKRDYLFSDTDNNMSRHVHDKFQAITGCQCCRWVFHFDLAVIILLASFAGKQV